MEAASGCPREELYRWRVSSWSICHRVGRKLWNSGDVFLSSSLHKDRDCLLLQTQNTPLVAGLLTQGNRISAAVQQAGASALGFIFSPSTEAFYCFSVQCGHNQNGEFFKNFSGNRIFLEVAFQRHGGKTCRWFFERKVIPYHIFLLPSQKITSSVVLFEEVGIQRLSLGGFCVILHWSNKRHLVCPSSFSFHMQLQ